MYTCGLGDAYHCHAGPQWQTVVALSVPELERTLHPVALGPVASSQVPPDHLCFQLFAFVIQLAGRNQQAAMFKQCLVPKLHVQNPLQNAVHNRQWRLHLSLCVLQSIGGTDMCIISFLWASVSLAHGTCKYHIVKVCRAMQNLAKVAYMLPPSQALHIILLQALHKVGNSGCSCTECDQWDAPNGFHAVVQECSMLFEPAWGQF
jgi:hypothetical protein